MRWIFAYGALMGDSSMRYYEARPATLPAFHRAFHHSSRQRWGSDDAPCPVLGLAPGGTC